MFTNLKKTIQKAVLEKKIKQSAPLVAEMIQDQLMVQRQVTSGIVNGAVGVVNDHAEEIANLVVELLPIIQDIKERVKVGMNNLGETAKTTETKSEGLASSLEKIWEDILK